MTMDDDIELPPVPPVLGAPGMNLWIDDLRRDAIRYDRERRALWEAQPAKPEVHSATLQLTTKGNLAMNPAINSIYACATVILRWTDDGRAWIDSERNRELATRLRLWKELGLARDEAADSLDGGAR